MGVGQFQNQRCVQERLSAKLQQANCITQACATHILGRRPIPGKTGIDSHF